MDVLQQAIIAMQEHLTSLKKSKYKGSYEKNDLNSL